MDFSVIIVNFNTKELLKNCLSSVFSQVGLKFEVWVVDNGSEDGSVQMVKAEFPKVRLIRNKENLGFAKANNLVLRKAEGNFLFLLNSDTILEDFTLAKNLDFLKRNSQVGALGIKILNFDGSPQPSVGKFYSLINVFLMLFGGGKLGLGRSSPSKISEVDWVSGAAIILRKEILEKVGFLDENFFMYMEEVEWCYRIKKAGFKIVFYPEVKIVHYTRGSGSKSEAIWGIYKGLIYFYQKHKPPWQLEILKIMLKVKAYLAWFLGYLLNDRYLRATYGQAFRLV